jgi:ferredoxin-fold anticodon binding domain-containing protein
MTATTNLEFPTKQELTARRHKIDVLLKKAVKGNQRAKEKLFDEYGIRVYSSSEVEEYKNSKLGRKIRKLSLGKGNGGVKKQVVRNR